MVTGCNLPGPVAAIQTLGAAPEGDWELRRRWVWKNGERPERFRLGIRTGAGECRWCLVGERWSLREASARIGARPARVSGGESGLDGWRHGELRLGRPRSFQERVLLSLDLPESVPQFAAERLGDIQQDAAVFGQREQAEPLAIVHRHHFQRGRQ